MAKSQMQKKMEAKEKELEASIPKLRKEILQGRLQRKLIDDSIGEKERLLKSEVERLDMCYELQGKDKKAQQLLEAEGRKDMQAMMPPQPQPITKVPTKRVMPESPGHPGPPKQAGVGENE